MGILDQYGIGWATRAPWDPAPAPASADPVGMGAPPSVGGSFDLPPWESRPVPDMAGAVQAGAQIADQARAVQPEPMPSEPAPGEIAFSDAESEADRLKFNPPPNPQPDSIGLIDPYSNAGRQGVASPQPEPDSIGLIDPYPPGLGSMPMPTMADYEAQQFRLHGAPPDPVNVSGPAGAQPLDPYGEPPFGPAPTGRPAGAIGQWVGAQPTDPFAGVEEKVAHGDTADLMAKTPIDPYDPGAISDRREAMAQAYANATPEQRAEMDAREAALYATKRQTMEMAQAQADQKAVEDNARIAKEAREKAARDMAQLQADVQGMASSSPFESWWADKSTAGKMGGVVAAIFSGLMNPHGPNGAIDMMMKLADDGAAQKWKKIEARRGLLGDQRAANADDATEREKIRLASREQAIRMIEAQMNGLDPEGTQALALGHTIAGLRAQDAQALQAYRAAQEKRELDIAAAESQRMQAQAQMLNAQSLAYQRGYGRAPGGGGVGGAGGASTAGYGPKDVHTGAEWAAYYAVPKDYPQPPGGNLTGKDMSDWLNKQKDFTQAAIETKRGKSVDQQTDLALNAVQIQGPGDKPAVNADGTQRLARTSAEADEAANKLFAARQIISMIDQIDAIREESAAYSRNDWVNSDAAQRLKTLGAALKVMTRNGTQGMSSDEDMKVLVASAGASDVQSFRDRSAGLKAGRERTLEALNGYYRDKLRYTGPAFTHKDFPNNYIPQPVDPKIRNLAAKPESKQPILSRDIGINDAIDRATPNAPGASEVVGAAKTIMRATPGVGMLFGGSPAGLAGEVAGYVGNKLSSSNTESKRNAAVDELRTQAVAGGPGGEVAVRTLGRVAHSDAADTAGRQAAMHALLDLLAAGGEPAALARAAITDGR